MIIYQGDSIKDSLGRNFRNDSVGKMYSRETGKHYCLGNYKNIKGVLDSYETSHNPDLCILALCGCVLSSWGLDFYERSLIPCLCYDMLHVFLICFELMYDACANACRKLRR